MTKTTGAATTGSWLLGPEPPGVLFTPERLSAEHRLIGQTAREFVERAVAPALERLERKDWESARRLLRQAGELGVLGTDVPHMYGGVQLDKAASIVVGEAIGPAASFSVSFAAQTSLCIVPLLCFGTSPQKAKYLPGLISGQLVGAYCLSEAGSGSDALSAKTRATRQGDGSFVLDGEKIWITNGGFADLFIVFAKVDGEHFTAFIVERASPGLSNGREEHKMGLHGSSTTPVLLQSVRVPAGNLLGEIGQGHKVAFNVLNYGRFKLGAFCSGSAKAAVAEATRYAMGRQQFGQPIGRFGAIRHKIGEMTLRSYVLESMLYRTAGLIDASLGGQDADDGAALLSVLEAFAVESSILKVAGSETLDFVLDENVQIHGGNGFVNDYPAERHYRDARVNRIFEGTNEINRLVIANRLVRTLRQYRTAGVPFGVGRQTADRSGGGIDAPGDPLTRNLSRMVVSLKHGAVIVLDTAQRRHGADLTDEQELLTVAADIAIDAFGADSALLRAQQAAADQVSSAALHLDAARLAVSAAAARVEIGARQVLVALADPETPLTQMDRLHHELTATPLDTIAIRRRLADATVEREGYPFQ